MILRTIFYKLPPQLRFLARRIFYLPLDIWESLSGKRDPLTPPRGLIYTGSGDFQAQGEKMLRFFIEKGGLQPDHKVLDVGSGIGRMAAPLTRYLNKNAHYEGFDVIKLGVRWCQKNISTRFPNFHFNYIPINNDLYRADGQDATQFRFPYNDESFDFTIVISVFTHLLPSQAENYLQEISRTLKPDGTCIATFFLLNEESTPLMPTNPAFAFPFNYGHYRLMDEQVKSANVAFEENYLQTQITNSGLIIAQTYYGYWCGRDKAACEDFQDVIILKKI
ncbi:MAG: class I SAM-dependent methyltransferase [Saprospiraceae bacterium]|nr:class I SAM-dependent methyltransferase [Saprospiraceae bacterium]